MRTALVAMMCMMPGLTGCGGGCNNGVLPLDDCDNPASNTMLASLDMVRPAGDGYAMVSDYDVIPFIYGGQGSPMIDIYLRMTGDVPGCLAQLTEVESTAGEPIALDRYARNTYPQNDGSYATKGIFLVMSEQWYGTLVRVTNSAGGQSAERLIYIDTDTLPDASGVTPDARIPDAALLDAPWGDAMVNDAGVSDAAVNDATVTDAMVNDAMVNDAMTPP